mgnify:CR=1 FL=1
MNVICPHCQHEFEMPYYEVGNPAKCSGCEEYFPLTLSQVLDRGDTGYHITCDDFRKLLSESMSASDAEFYVTVPVQHYSALGPVQVVSNPEDHWAFCSPDRKTWYDAGLLHQVIQKFPEPTYRLYQYAMSIWR